MGFLYLYDKLNFIIFVTMIVYRHRRLDTNEVFYIGIGKTNKRAYSKRNRNKHWNNIVSKCGYQVEILHSCDIWEDACELEQLLISEYGRKDLGSGCLVNMTDGGEGLYNPSKEIRSKIGSVHKGKFVSKRTKKRMSEAKIGVNLTYNHRENISKSQVGIKHKPHTSKYKPVVMFEVSGKKLKEFKSIQDAYDFIGLCYNSSISLCCKGKRKTAGGYIWKYK